MGMLIFMNIKNPKDIDAELKRETRIRDLDAELEREIKTLESILGSEALAKACTDDAFDYALKLRTGEVVRFIGAKLLNREWVNITLAQNNQWDTRNNSNPFPFSANRGVDIRISDIVWVMDAPNGS